MLLSREDLPWQKGTDWQLQRWKTGSSVLPHPAPCASNPRPAGMTFKNERVFFRFVLFYHRKAHLSSPLKYNDTYLVTVNWVMQIHVYRSE